jgi:hypothetical protein
VPRYEPQQTGPRNSLIVGVRKAHPNLRVPVFSGFWRKIRILAHSLRLGTHVWRLCLLNASWVPCKAAKTDRRSREVLVPTVPVGMPSAALQRRESVTVLQVLRHSVAPCICRWLASCVEAWRGVPQPSPSTTLHLQFGILATNTLRRHKRRLSGRNDDQGPFFQTGVHHARYCRCVCDL